MLQVLSTAVFQVLKTVLVPTQEADDPPDLPTLHLVDRLLPSQDMEIRQAASWYGEVSFGCFVGQEGWEKTLKGLCLFF